MSLKIKNIPSGYNLVFQLICLYELITVAARGAMAAEAALAGPDHLPLIR